MTTSNFSSSGRDSARDVRAELRRSTLRWASDQ